MTTRIRRAKHHKNKGGGLNKENGVNPLDPDYEKITSEIGMLHWEMNNQPYRTHDSQPAPPLIAVWRRLREIASQVDQVIVESKYKKLSE